jgi:hypothetical protein
MQNGYRVPTASAGAAQRAANPLAVSAARIALRISNLLKAIAASQLHFTTQSALGPSRQPILNRRCRTQANMEFVRQVRGTKFRKTPITQYLLTLALVAFRKRCCTEVTVIRANNGISLTRPWGLYQLERE